MDLQPPWSPPSEAHQAREPGLGIQGGPRDEEIRVQGLHQEALDLLHRVLRKGAMEWNGWLLGWMMFKWLKRSGLTLI